MEAIFNRLCFLLMATAIQLLSRDGKPTDTAVRIADLENKFLNLLDKHNGIIWKVCHRFFSDEEDRKDLYQDIMSRLWLGFPSYRGEAKVSTWVHTIAYNTAVTKISQKQVATKPFGEIPEEFHPLTQVDSHIDPKISAILDDLPELERVILMELAEESQFAEIAKITGIRANTLAQRIRRLRVKLKNKIAI